MSTFLTKAETQEVDPLEEMDEARRGRMRVERSFAARDDPAVADLASFVAQARSALERPGPLAGAEDRVPGRPGLYAIYGDATTWEELGLGQPSDDRALYVGKAEDSLVSRDLKTHFGDGRTGQSTVRRSFAALLPTRSGCMAYLGARKPPTSRTTASRPPTTLR